MVGVAAGAGPQNLGPGHGSDAGGARARVAEGRDRTSSVLVAARHYSAAVLRKGVRILERDAVR